MPQIHAGPFEQTVFTQQVLHFRTFRGTVFADCQFGQGVVGGRELSGFGIVRQTELCSFVGRLCIGSFFHRKRQGFKGSHGVVGGLVENFKDYARKVVEHVGAGRGAFFLQERFGAFKSGHCKSSSFSNCTFQGRGSLVSPVLAGLEPAC